MVCVVPDRKRRKERGSVKALSQLPYLMGLVYIVKMRNKVEMGKFMYLCTHMVLFTRIRSITKFSIVVL